MKRTFFLINLITISYSLPAKPYEQNKRDKTLRRANKMNESKEKRRSIKEESLKKRLTKKSDELATLERDVAEMVVPESTSDASCVRHTRVPAKEKQAKEKKITKRTKELDRLKKTLEETKKAKDPKGKKARTKGLAHKDAFQRAEMELDALKKEREKALQQKSSDYHKARRSKQAMTRPQKERLIKKERRAKNPETTKMYRDTRGRGTHKVSTDIATELKLITQERKDALKQHEEHVDAYNQVNKHGALPSIKDIEADRKLKELMAKPDRVKKLKETRTGRKTNLRKTVHQRAEQ